MKIKRGQQTSHWQFLSVSCLMLLMSLPAGAIKFGSPTLTEEQKAKKAEQEIYNAPLKIGPNCEPSSFTTKIWLKTLNDAELKRFWLGQRFAVERTYREEVQAERNRKMNDDADAKIAAIERQRNAANLAAYGIPPIQDPELDRVIAGTDAMLAQMWADIAREQAEWARRCYGYSDARSK